MHTGTGIVCPHCAAVNRLAEGRDPLAARCGRCGDRLFDGRPVEADARMFDRQITRSAVPVLVDVWAPWCGPCQAMAPAFAAAAARIEPRARLIKLNSDMHQAITARLGIRGIPTMMLFRDGKEAGRISGALNTSQLIGWVEDRLPVSPTAR